MTTTTHQKVIWHGFVEFIGFFPVLMLVGVLFFHEPVQYLWFVCLFLLFVCGYTVRQLLQNRWFVIGMMAVIAIVLHIVMAPTIWAILLGVIVGFVVNYRGIQHAENDWHAIFPIRFFWMLCMPLYFVFYLIFRYTSSLSDFQHWISVAGFIFIAILLFMTNQDHLQKESLAKGKKRIGPEITKLNRVYLVIMLLIVFALTNFQVVQSALFHGLRSIIQSFVWFVSLFGGGEEVVVEEPSQSMERPMLPSEETDPSWIREWVETITYVIGGILVVLTVLLFVAMLFKKFRRFVIRAVRALWQTMQQVFGKTSDQETHTDYQDEKESLMDWKKWRKENREKLYSVVQRVTRRKPKFNQLSSEERVRFLYNKLASELREMDKWHPSLTAHEVLYLTENREKLKQLEKWYDDIRYGQKSIDHETTVKLEQLWQELNQK
ncbi:hypothetical protein SH601_01415 [Gracilibacillus sp. S3-1-1]|uniref:Uncharacterized protein n=1 Tax=Gracilibacillus pellucidus TaxID=3095368 RepID=A0ACC6M118_9BACI|nr:hypothetical protein [Gracilibacillus sp. S3-1-1]MDX8044632.1 hypothetical protein [Gracilibacillus sp. S3-1-1]